MSNRARKDRKRAGVKFVHPEKVPTGRGPKASYDINLPMSREMLEMAMELGRQAWRDMSPRDFLR